MTSGADETQRLRDLALLRRVRDRMDREYAQPLDVEALARGVHMSAGPWSRSCSTATTTRSCGGSGARRPAPRRPSSGSKEGAEMAAPDFEAMSRDEVAHWLMDNDSGAVTATMPAGPTGRFVQVDAGRPVPQVVTVKMSSDVVARLDVAAERDREGRSGIIQQVQQAVVEWLERHSPAA